jgi:hypothetical protein
MRRREADLIDNDSAVAAGAYSRQQELVDEHEL